MIIPGLIIFAILLTLILTPDGSTTRTLSSDMERMLNWPEFADGLKELDRLVREKESCGDTSPTKYRIQFVSPHRWCGQDYIVMEHDPKDNHSITF